jgi:threonine dehydratase
MSLEPEDYENGVYAYSSGNHGQGLAYSAKQLGIKCTIWTRASPMKVEAMKRLGAEIRTFPYPKTSEEWSTAFEQMNNEMTGLNIDGTFTSLIAGYGTIGLEILEDLPGVDAILMPVGSGANLCGIGSVIKAIKPNVKIYGCEIETATPLTSGPEAGKMVNVTATPSFINAIGYPMMMPNLWGIGSQVASGTIVVSLREVCDSVRLLIESNKIVSEGAAAVSVAAALSGKAGKGKIACIITGGNIDTENLKTILKGNIPKPD